MARRMAVVPEDIIKSSRFVQREDTNLENDIISLMERENIPDDVKVKLLGQLQSRYQRIVRRPPEPLRVSLTDQIAPTENQISPGMEDVMKDDAMTRQVILSVPFHAKRYVVPIIQRRRENNLGWNERGELLINSTPVPQSHLVDLFSYLMRNRKADNAPPGFWTFFHQLRSINIPAEWILNKELKQQNDGVRAKMEFPPGPSNTPLLPITPYFAPPVDDERREHFTKILHPSTPRKRSSYTNKWKSWKGN